MPEAANTTVLLVSFALYTLAIVAVGIYSARFARRSDEDYFLAGRSLGPWVAALSASASSESGWVTLGLVGWAFASGAQAYWIVPGCLLGYLFNWLVIAPRLRERAAATGALTLPDFFAFSFRERVPVLRILSVIVILVAMLLYVAAQFAAAGKAFEAAFASVEYWHGVLIGGAIVLVYTVLGGFRAACWTDFLQSLLMVAALVGFPVYLLVQAGGFGPLFEQLEAVTTADGENAGLARWIPQMAPVALFGFFLGSSALGINFGYPGQPHVLVRYMALKDAKAARFGAIISGSWMMLTLSGAVTIGLLARAMSEGGAEWGQVILADMAAGGRSKQDVALILAASNMLPGMLAGAVLAAVLAAICSTADSQLVVAASSAANDIYARLFARGSKRSHGVINRLVVFGLGAGAVLLVIKQEVNVYTYVLTYGWAALGAAFGPQVILILLWRRTTWAGCVAGMLTGFVIALAWPDVYPALAGKPKPDVEIYNLPLGFALGMAVNVAVSLLGPGGRAREGDRAREGPPAG